ncbi:MAG: DUF3618 domain-containing protein [Actinomycetes bacterium]
MASRTATQGGLEARPPQPPAPRTPAEIEAEIERTRARLAGTVDAIAERVKPANVVRRGMDSARAQVIDEDGKLRPGRVGALAVALAATVGLVLWRRSR